jgi:hypothetical protein
MTVQTVTYPVLLDPFNIPLPLTLASPWQGSTVARWVVITNITPYVVNLSGTGDDLQNTPALGPGAAQKYRWSNVRGAINATWTNPFPPNVAPATSAYLTAEFTDDPTGDELAGVYPTSPTPSQPVSGVNLSSIGYNLETVIVYIVNAATEVMIAGFPPVYLWGWGISMVPPSGTFIPSPPTAGLASLYSYAENASNPDYVDTISTYEPASDRTQGIITQNIKIVSYVNNPAYFFINVSLVNPTPG